MRSNYNKEDAFYTKWMNGTVSKDVWQYIPNSKAEAVSDAFVDNDGYWVYLEPEFTHADGAEDCGIIHAHTIADLKDGIRTIRRK